jgi:hypothetical protein
MTKPNHAIAQKVLVLLQSEADARRLQQELLAMPGLEPEDADTVRETSTDESNHAMMYEAMYKKYSGISPATDGLANALAEIIDGVDLRAADTT